MIVFYLSLSAGPLHTPMLHLLTLPPGGQDCSSAAAAAELLPQPPIQYRTTAAEQQLEKPGPQSAAVA
jgi:hypothetical protein